MEIVHLIQYVLLIGYMIGYSIEDSFYIRFKITTILLGSPNNVILACITWNCTETKSQSIYVFATISLANHYHNITGKAFILCNRLLPGDILKQACQSFSGKKCVWYPKREQFKLITFLFWDNTHTYIIFTKETLASLYKNISGKILLGWIPCQWFYGICFQVILLQWRKCFGSK